MTFHVSTGLRNEMLMDNGLRYALTNDEDTALGVPNKALLRIYAGVPPVDADASLGSATMLCEVTAAAGGGLLLGDASGGIIPKDPAQTWSGVNVASGTATFYRLVKSDDTGASSVTDIRVQGSVGLAGADMNMASTTLVVGAVQPVNYFIISLPTPTPGM